MKRFYLVNTEETDLDVIGCSDEEFINEAEKQGTIYENLDTFIRDFNHQYFSTETHQLRVIKNITKILETHQKLRDILIEYGNEEYGDCIIDELCQATGFPTTVELEELGI